jgi:hypothetical protein
MQLAMYKGPPTTLWHTVGHEATCLWTFTVPVQAQAVATGGAVAGLTPAQAAQLQALHSMLPKQLTVAKFIALKD